MSQSNFDVRGADDFYRLSKAMKHAGETGLRRELNGGLRAGAKPLIAQSRAEAIRRLPNRNGLGTMVAKTPQRVQVRTGAATAGVRIAVGKTRSGARGANRGVVRHPVFGHDVYVDQSVEPGWFDDPMREGAPLVRPELEAAMERVIRQIVEGVRRG